MWLSHSQQVHPGKKQQKNTEVTSGYTACVFLSIQFTPWRKKYICPSVFYHRLSRKQTCGVLELLPAVYGVAHWAEPQLSDTQPLSPSLTPTASQPGAAGIHTERPDWESNTWTISTWGASANCCTAELSPELSGSLLLEPKILHDRLVRVWFEVWLHSGSHRRTRKKWRKQVERSCCIQTIRTWMGGEREDRGTAPKAFPVGKDKTLLRASASVHFLVIPPGGN